MNNSYQNQIDQNPPYAFTMQGLIILSSVLYSDKAINLNRAIKKANVDFTSALLKQTDLTKQMQILKNGLGEHNVQLNVIYEAMENLIDENAAQRKWENRRRIGFVSNE